MVNNCNWCLGEKPADVDGQAYQEALQKDESIATMMQHLYPILSEKQVRDLVNNDIEDGFIVALKKQNTEASDAGIGFFNAKRSKAMGWAKACNGVNHAMYGYNPEESFGLFKAAYRIIPDTFKAIGYGFNQLFAKKGKDVVIENAEDQTATHTAASAA
jgi:hypothetical protein